MRALALIVISMCTALAPAAAAAQDAAELRRQIEQLQKQLDAVTDRLKRLEAQPPPAATPPPPAPAVAAPPPAAAPPSALDLARPREPFALYQQRGAGQLLFDMGVAGDFVGNLTQRNVEQAGGGTFSGLENRFFPREVELSLFGQVDPYASRRCASSRREKRSAAESSSVHLARGELHAPHAAVRHSGASSA